MRTKLRNWIGPVVYLSNNWLSMTGVLLVTTSTVFWLFLLPSTWEGDSVHPYLGILSFLILPGGFFGGLALIPIGMAIERRRHGRPDVVAPLDFSNPKLRRLATLVGVTTFANLLLGSQFTYRAVTYMDSVSFCGQACHQVMQPEFAAYQNSPHSRVECVKCHIGPGASWFVRSKLSGTWQVVAVALDLYPRPIPTPVANLRPARETCESCHWPQKYGADRLRIIDKYAEDEKNTLSKTVLLMRIGGGAAGPGIHGAHLGGGIVIRYRPSDPQRQKIPWVEVSRDGRTETYLAKGETASSTSGLETRVMDCMDCHNRPTHAFEAPDRALDHAFASGALSPELPFLKKTGLEVLRKPYASGDEAIREIRRQIADYYGKSYPEIARQKAEEIRRAGERISDIYARNVFPHMRVTWGTYPNNIGHTDFPGCFRCHDGDHTGAGGKSIEQDCNACHQLLAMEEESPKILSDLGIAR
jgi:hypothetical protein